MPTWLFALLVLSGAALYFMTPEERTRLAGRVVGAIRTAVHAARHPSDAGDPFGELLRARTRWTIVTPLLVALHVISFTLMAMGPGAFGDPETAVHWGANFAPRTTNGEWARLIVSTFVHGGMLHLMATIAGLVPLGLILERAVGGVTFAVIYLSAGLLASLVSLWTMSPTSVTYGPSGAIFGVYGLLLASLIWAIVQRPPVGIPLTMVQRVAATAVPFVLYNLLTDHLPRGPEMAGFGTGLIGGLLIARGVTREKPALRRAAMLAAATGVMAIGAAIPLRGIIDFRPHIAHIAAVEQRTAGVYDTAVGEFKLGRMPAKRLAQVIEKTILPDLQRVRERLNDLRGVPREQAPLVEAAQTYFKLREQSWRRRAEGLLRANLVMLREAERTELAALEAFQKIQPQPST
jgi:membrane associated rhomboid family serine protease